MQCKQLVSIENVNMKKVFYHAWSMTKVHVGEMLGKPWGEEGSWCTLCCCCYAVLHVILLQQVNQVMIEDYKFGHYCSFVG